MQHIDNGFAGTEQKLIASIGSLDELLIFVVRCINTKPFAFWCWKEARLGNLPIFMQQIVQSRGNLSLEMEMRYQGSTHKRAKHSLAQPPLRNQQVLLARQC